MNHRHYLFLFVFMLFHLHVFAGETISVSSIASLKPVVQVQLREADMAGLHDKGIQAAPEWLAVYMVVNDTPAAMPVAGEYRIDKGHLQFVPYNTLGYGLQFEAQYKNGNTVVSKKRFTTPPKPAPGKAAEVVKAYPLTDTIPHNALYFHIRFSKPMMNDQQAFNYVKVFDESGEERTNAWRQKSFWLDEGKLLVLMVHPGRVKRGIDYGGPLFDTGKRYTIRVEKDIKDADGNPIAAAYSRSYYVTSEDYNSPKVDFTEAEIPRSGSLTPLVITFSEGMDYASVWDGTSVADAAGKTLPVKVDVAGKDNTYTITPLQQWKKGKYALSLKSAVYDFAANRINRLFEIKDSKEMEKDKIVTRWNFEIK